LTGCADRYTVYLHTASLCTVTFERWLERTPLAMRQRILRQLTDGFTAMLPVLVVVAMFPRLAVPEGAVVCFRPCGDLVVTTPWISHSCHHRVSPSASPGQSHGADCRHGDHCSSDNDVLGSEVPTPETSLERASDDCVDLDTGEDPGLPSVDRVELSPLTLAVLPLDSFHSGCPSEVAHSRPLSRAGPPPPRVPSFTLPLRI